MVRPTCNCNKRMILGQRLECLRHWLGTGSINLFGLPFSGKDAQCRILRDWTYGAILSGGALLRDKGNLREEARAIMESGGLIPLKDYLSMVVPIIGSDQYQDQPLIFSSVGRLFGEQDSILAACEASQHPIRAVIFLDVPEEECIARHDSEDLADSRGVRADDDDEAFAARFAAFESGTRPVIEAYRDLGLLSEVSGLGSEYDVALRITTALHDYAFT